MKTQPDERTDPYKYGSTSQWLLGAACSLRRYKEQRENGDEIDTPKEAFPAAGFDGLKIESSTDKPDGPKREDYWPDKQGRYWWRLTLEDGTVSEDYYWMRDEVRGYPDKADSCRYWFSIHHAPSGTKIEGFSEESDYQKGFPEEVKSLLAPTIKYWWQYIKYTECGAIKEWMEEKDLNYLDRIERENPGLYAQEVAVHPDIQQRQKARQKMRATFYEEKVADVSIEHLPFQMVVAASNSSFSSQPVYGLENRITIGHELFRMGLAGTDNSACALIAEFKARKWENKRLAHQEIFYWLAEKHAETYVTALFQSALKDSAAPNINVIAFMMQASKSVALFKLPFTLSSILWKEKDSDKEALRQLIYLALKRIVEEQIVRHPGAKCITMFNLLLKSALKKDMINEKQFHELDNMVERMIIFSDERFLNLEREIEILKKQFSNLDMRTGIPKNNLQLVADSVDELKYAFQEQEYAIQKQKERELYLSIITFSLSCFGAPSLINAMTNVADLSNLAEIGSVILEVPVEKSQSYLDDGLQALEYHERAIAYQGKTMMREDIGFYSGRFLNTWVTANVMLQGTPQDKQQLMAEGSALSAVSSSGSSSSSSLAYANENGQAELKGTFSKVAVSTSPSTVTQSGPPKPIVVNDYSAAAPSPARELPSTPVTNGSSSSSTMNAQHSSSSFFAQPGKPNAISIDGIVLQQNAGKMSKN